ncbi:MAG TPA: universal stress protein [Anaeromyxobacteraceae bacterium]|nr:universal stress protein [Anaeromyxobacteraceae bacterium]
MLPLEKISVAIDFSEASRVALAHAVELSRRLRADLTLVHVHPPLPPGDPLLPSSKGSASIASAEEQLEAWRREAEREVEAPVRAKLLFGDAAGEVLRQAELGACDLLVVGTRARPLVPRLLLGSVAERLVRESPCPVLVAHGRRAVERAEEADEAAQYR